MDQHGSILPVNEALIVSTSKAATLMAAGNSAATEGISSRAAELANRTIRGMKMRQIGKAAAVVLAVLLLGGGAGLALDANAHDGLSAARKAIAPQPAPAPKAEPAPVATQPAPAPIPKPPEDPYAGYVEKLGDALEETRESAESELRKAGEQAKPALEAGLKSDDPEVKSRCEKLLGVLKTKPVLDKLLAQMKEMKTFDADIEMKIKMMGQDMLQKGHLIATGDDKQFALDVNVKLGEMEVKSRIFCDGETMWVDGAAGGQKFVQKMSLASMDKMMPGVRRQNATLSSIKDMAQSMDFTDISDGTVDGFDVLVLEGHVRDFLDAETKQEIKKQAGDSVLDQFKGMKRAKLQLDKSKLFLRKSEIFDAAGNVMVMMHFTNVTLDKPVTPETFKFTPPEGVAVMDMDAMFKAQEAAKQAPANQDAATPPAPPPANSQF